MKELRRFDLTPLRRPHGIDLADGKVYFTAEANRLVARYNPAANLCRGHGRQPHRRH